MQFVRIIGMILGSVWFLVAGCTAGTFIVAPIVIPKFNTKEVEKGEQLHPWLSVVAEPGDNGLPFRVIRKDNLDSVISHYNKTNGQIKVEHGSIPISFLMSEPSGRIETEYNIISYEVLEDFGDEQIIELEEDYKKVDITKWSHYKAQLTSVFPLSSSVSNFRSDTFTGFIIAFCGSMALFLFGRFLLRYT